jgi:hypothetical protein
MGIGAVSKIHLGEEMAGKNKIVNMPSIILRNSG